MVRYVSEHFTREEFSCNDNCGFEAVDSELLIVLEDLREHFNKPITITSGNRCLKHNKRVGGSKNSQHTKGLAADIKISNVPTTEVYTYLNSIYPDTYGIGLYPSWIHIDVRSRRVRWRK